jgi:hypothetical protein
MLTDGFVHRGREKIEILLRGGAGHVAAKAGTAPVNGVHVGRVVKSLAKSIAPDARKHLGSGRLGWQELPLLLNDMRSIDHVMTMDTGSRAPHLEQVGPIREPDRPIEAKLVVVSTGCGVRIMAGLAGEHFVPAHLYLESIGDGNNAAGCVAARADRIIDTVGEELW